MTPTNLASSTMKIARSLLGTRMRGARLLLRDLSGLGGTVEAWQPDAGWSRLLPCVEDRPSFILASFPALCEGTGLGVLREDPGMHEAGAAERRSAEAE